MPGPEPHRLIDIVGEAARRPPHARAEFVRAACPSDEMYREAMSLLAALHGAGDFLDRPTQAGATSRVGADEEHVLTERPGSVIGRYTLLEQIGEGGFGAVFRAEQREPIQREVALKVIKLGMDTKAVIARFEAERQALAIMDHPNIAKVLDAGATDAGRPYFVMELVKGEPITRYCDTQNLTVAQRLELFTQICRAVQHAHAKGIIHRDLKPSNVLVAEQDGRPAVRVIDFGIAKATDSRLAEKFAFTEKRQLVGTPEYMSPEQAAGIDDIDTRTDVYSLGVLLYELLTGATPFDGKRLRSAAFAELQRIIREDDPPRPSTRLSRAQDDLPKIAQRRGTEPRKLNSQVRGELDWIVMRAMEKDRARRYDSPGNLAADIERYLSGQAVEAAPPSAAYQAKKFVRRHRGPVIAAALVTLALIVGVVATGLALIEANHQRDRARLAEGLANRGRTEAEKARDDAEKAKSDAEKARDEAVAARNEAERFNRIASAVTEFFTKDVLDLKPSAPDLTIREALDRVPEKIKDNFSKEPAVEGSIRERVGQLYLNMGKPKRAAEFLEAAHALLEKGLGPEHKTTLGAAQRLASLWFMLEDDERAAELFGKVHEARLRVYGTDHNFTWNSLERQGCALVQAGKHEEGLKLVDRAVGEFKRMRGEYSRPHLISLHSQIECYAIGGRAVEGEKIARDALETIRAKPAELGRAEMSFRGLLADTLMRQKRYEEALTEIDPALEARAKEYTPEHDEVLAFRITRGETLIGLGRHADAKPEFEACYAIHALHHGEDAKITRRVASRLRDIAEALGDAPGVELWGRRAQAKGPTTESNQK